MTKWLNLTRSIHRGAAFFVENAEQVLVQSCIFNQTGGNAVFFSNHVSGSTIDGNEFVFIGDSAVAFLGSTNGIDGTATTVPFENTVSGNHMHETGIYGKQVDQ